jgi:5-(carboxyamino)imidazole ribonucleotide synthase
MIASQYNNPIALQQLVEECDVVTYEFENVDLELVARYHHKIPQGAKALQYSRNRLLEKRYANSLGIPTPHFKEVHQRSDIFVPSIVKTNEGGYDGKGQFLLRSKQDVDHILINDTISYICEEYITFDFEVSCVATRSSKGEIVFYPIARNIHRNGILSQSIIYDDIPESIITLVHQYTKKIIDDLDYVGTLAVEYFVRENEVLFNEFAPRPHNSGHYTIEGCNVSQFDNHIRAITGQSLVEPKLVSYTFMINELAENEDYVKRIDNNICTYHDYFKSERKPQRKMGHITCTDNDIYRLERSRKHILGD